MTKHNIELMFPLFWICLVIATYMGAGEPFLLGATVLICLIVIKKTNGVLQVHRNGNVFFRLFVLYYILVSTAGILTGYVGFKNYIELFFKYVFLPMIIYVLVPDDYKKRLEMLKIIKNIIFVSTLYGVVESLIKYNYMVDFVQLNTKTWVQAMNNASNYQPCSLFLHYNYLSLIHI